MRARQHHLQLELVELAAELGRALGDLGVEAAVVPGLLRQLDEDAEVGGLAAQLVDARDRAREVGPLTDQVLGSAVVVPEGRRGHLGVELLEARFLAGQVKDAPGARPPAASARRPRA